MRTRESSRAAHPREFAIVEGLLVGADQPDRLHLELATVLPPCSHLTPPRPNVPKDGVHRTQDSSHIANAAMRSRIERVCRSAGYEPPVICTPHELMEVSHGDQ